jgi:hypothetical protein
MHVSSCWVLLLLDNLQVPGWLHDVKCWLALNVLDMLEARPVRSEPRFHQLGMVGKSAEQD